jgi:RNA polymerase sigma-70 factor, ECF subfamily
VELTGASGERGVAAAHATAEAVARRSYGKLVAFLAARTRDVALAEDALAEAFAAALVDWPLRGVPRKPEAWLLTAARRKVIDMARRRRTSEAAAPELRRLASALESATESEDVATEIPDDRLALMFACAHPAIDVAVRAPLMLQAVLGFSAERIASAFLTSPATMGQRLVRAKTKIRRAGIPLGVPGREELPDRLSHVLDAIYAAFAWGWTDPEGADCVRRDLAEEAIFLGRLLIELLPDEPEALGLVALMLHAEARRGARRSAANDYVPLAEQHTQLWDQRLIATAEELLRRASGLGAIGRYQLEAAVQSAHVHRRLSGQTNWPAIVALYDALRETVAGSPVVAINRALAIGELRGASEGLRALDAVAADARLKDYQPYWAARAALLVQIGADAQARSAYDLAIGLEHDPAVRRFLQRRRAALGS